MSATTRATKPALSFVQLQVRREAILSALILVAAPLLLRWWARREAEHHDTLECRNVVQTYLIASSGWACAVLAAVAGKPISAVVLQAAWRAAAARSLWTWSDLGRGLIRTPGWLHASVAWWRGAATLLAGAGAVTRILGLLIAMTGTWTATTAAGALCAPTLDFLPAGLVRWASTPDDNFGLSAAQLVLGVGMYAWIAYYACFFLPYRVLYEEYQSYERRTAQVVRDMGNGPEQDVMLSTKLGPQLPRQLLRRMAKMPPGDDRDVLEAAGIVRQKAGSHTVVKAAKSVKNKDGKVGVKMLALKFGDLRYWGSDLFERFEQQLRRDKKTGRKSPDAPGSGPNRENRMTYSKIRREVKVELGKTDAEMNSDPSLSMSNLMTFDPDAEDGDPPELVKQERPGSIDAGGENLRMKSGHEKVVTTDSTPADMARAAGVPPAAAAPAAPEVVRSTDKVSYKIGDSAGKALEDSIRSMSSSSPPGRGAPEKMTPATATPGFAVSEKQQRQVSTGKQADVVAVGVDSPPKGSKSGSGTGSGSDEDSGKARGEEQVSRRTGAISDKCDDIASLAMEFSMRSGGSSAKKNATDTSAPPPPSPRGPPPPTARDLSTVSHMQSFVLAHELFLEYSVIVSDCFPTLT
ncbi:expressed unknown protein [Ectocarpus siliculosus]|uniref:Uncharacterized protein n=1 Tax=Ectocarpus siliculosus TaxID=2880 RepID=D7FN96_ECTSI|nr:expressed unknown protein [Ectocarpus siliculosus]|eukprot:CBJ30153.1 expressed unknown protein [Ectocarpus siliculosus]